MEINRIYRRPARIPLPRQQVSARAITDSTETAPVGAIAPKDRRQHPDRRQRQLALKGPDRRKRKDRRQPKLLQAHSARPDSLEDRRGSHVDASA